MRNRAVLLSALLLLAGLTGAWVSAAVHGPQVSELIYTVGFVQVPEGGDAGYMELESDLFKPIHENRIEAGELKEWLLFSVESRDRGEAPYGYVVINVYESADQVGATSRAERPILAEVHPGMTEEELVSKRDAARVINPVETWKLIDRAW